jgi:hypothetical protein
MGDETTVGDFPDESQRAAVCHGQWDKSQEQMSSEGQMTSFRSSDGSGLVVDREARIIRNVSVITRGPAKGHGLFVDDTTLQQVLGFMRYFKNGVRVRVSHPEIQPDGTRTDGATMLLGKGINPRIEGDHVRCDVRFGAYANDTAKGRMGDYFLGLAAEDPDSFGLSIYFMQAKPEIKDGRKNVRIASLHSLDFSDDPATNPDGLMSANTGAQSVPPDTTTKGDFPMADEKKETQAPVEVPATEPAKFTAQEPKVDVNEVVRIAMITERERIEKLTALCKTYKIGPTVFRALIDSGADETQAKAAILDARTTLAVPSDTRVEVGEDLNRSTLTAAVEDAIALKAGCRLVKTDDEGNVEIDENHTGFSVNEGGASHHTLTVGRKAHDRATEFRNRRLVDIGRMYFEKMGHTGLRNINDLQIADWMLNPHKMTGFNAPLGTADFSNILANVMNKSLRKAYVEAPVKWPIWCVRGTAADFKTITRAQLMGVPGMPKVPEGAEYGYAHVVDQKETFTLATYGKIVKITRQCVINDDLGAFNRLPTQLANAAKRLEDYLAFDQLIGNTTMADGGTLFNATAVTSSGGHYNYLSSGSGAPTVAYVSGLAKMMRKQVAWDKYSQKYLSDTTNIPNPDKVAGYLDLDPAIILVPTEYSEVVKQLYTSPIDPTATYGHASNPWQGGLIPVVSAQMSDVTPTGGGAAATVWYLSASPSVIDTVEVCFLEGEQQPVIEREVDFMSDALAVKVRHTVASAPLEWRGMAKTIGTA